MAEGPGNHPGDEPAALDGVLARLLELIAALRRSGLPATQAEAIDAVRTLPYVELLEREQLREALAAVVITTRSHRRPFDELFDLYFPARPVDDGSDDTSGAGDGDDGEAGRGPEDEHADLLEELLGGGDDAIRRAARRAVEEHGRVEGRDGRPTYFQYRVLRAIDLQRLLRDLLQRAQDDRDSELTPFEERLLRDAFEERLRTFQQEVEAEIRRHAAEDRGVDQVADRVVRAPVEDLDLFHLTREEQVELRSHVRPLARKLATRVAAKRREGRSGRLDVRRTVRRSLATGGVPFEPSFRPRRPHKPELFVLCDVSGSVASFSRFTLQLVHALQEQFSTVRSFAFIDALDEVTPWFSSDDPGDAMQRMLTEAELVWLDGHSDYGRSFERFHLEYAPSVTPRATVLVLGDARNNYRQANAWVLQDLQRRARHVYWLNPEPRRFWDSGDSIAASYARYVDEMVEVRNLNQLARFVERIA
ncbi:MAG: VWA domain-containing protein [Nitriliruptoraceae bacterium]